jgi:type VI secretion system protein ImpJ
MSRNNKVIWSEGMFLRPQHFQQHARYIERLVEGRNGDIRPYPWGFKQLSIDHKALTLGKISITSARGVFPDGTPFNIPDDDEPPLILDIPENVHETELFLAIPARSANLVETDTDDDVKSLARHLVKEYDVRDSNAGTDSNVQIQVGKLRMRLLLASQEHGAYSCLGVTRVIESRVDKNVILDDAYIPPVLDCGASLVLSSLIKELQGLLHHRGEALAGRITASGRGGAAEIADFLLLQAVNRYEPLFAHLVNVDTLHPEDFFRIAVQVAGELATFTSQNKRPTSFPAYLHEDLKSSLAPVIAQLRQSLSMVLEQTAIAIPLQERKYGIRVGAITDRKLLDTANFVLAVSAKMPAEELRTRFPTQIKIGPVEKIRELVNLQLPGIRVRPLPVAPRQIPYHAGFVYFELDRGSEFWKELANSGGFALHIGGEFPGLEMEFWAIKG